MRSDWIYAGKDRWWRLVGGTKLMLIVVDASLMENLSEQGPLACAVAFGFSLPNSYATVLASIERLRHQSGSTRYFP